MDMILKNTFQSISPAYELIGDVTVGSNTTQVDFTGLNIGKDDELLLVSDIINANTGATSAVSLYCNSNTTAGNYYEQYLNADATSVSGGRENNAKSFIVDANTKLLGFSQIKLSNSGYFVCQSSNVRMYADSRIKTANMHGTSTFTTTSITALNIRSDVSNGIGTGSRFQLYKLVAEKVADIIVPSNTTSVDITGLDIGKGNEYMLIADIPTPAVNPDFMICVNGNYTLTNYYSQRLRGNGTTVDAIRKNDPRFGFEQSPERFFGSLNIKLTNNGHFVFQSNTITHYGHSSLFLAKYSGASMFTMADITSLRILSSLSNAIGANSRFTLYKMK